MSATKTAATAAGRALIKAGSRTLPAKGGGSRVARGLASITLHSNRNHRIPPLHQGLALVVGAVAGVVALSESDSLDAIRLWQRRSFDGSPMARIEEFYTVESGEFLGRGQFGTVCKATDKATGEVVAVKCVPRTAASEAHFRDEADVHREAAKHPNVVGLKGVFADENCWYMVMQLADGGELFDRLTTEGSALDDVEVRSLLRDTADALKFLHDRSIVHGDVKPENLLLTAPSTDNDNNNTTAGADNDGAILGGIQAAVAAAAATAVDAAATAVGAAAPPLAERHEAEGDSGEVAGETIDGGQTGDGEGECAAGGGIGKVLLSDFGSSFRIRGGGGGGGSGGMKTVKEYTVAYSAPEVVDHSPEISTKADVWSLGVIAYVMVKGHHPFDPTSDADDDEISENILHSEPDWDGVEPKAATLIRQMLSRDPRERPSAREVLTNSWLQQSQ